MEGRNYCKIFFVGCCVSILIFCLASPSFAQEPGTSKNIKLKIRIFPLPEVFRADAMSISYHGLSSKMADFGSIQQEGQALSNPLGDSLAKQSSTNINARIREIGAFLFRYIHMDAPIHRDDANQSVFSKTNRQPTKKIAFEFESTPSDLSAGILFMLNI